MALHLTEILTGAGGRAAAEELVERLRTAATEAGGRLLEVQVSEDFTRVFFVTEDADPVRLAGGVAELGVARSDPAPVRLVGATVDAVRARAAGPASHLVEWDFPAGLDMDTYLARKKEKAPLYSQVPEVAFLRTYVREDMGKCLCLYDAPDDAAVVRAREVVTTPIDRLHRLAEPADAAAASPSQP